MDTEVKKTKVNSNNPQLRIRTTSLKGNIILVDYLNNFPLFSSKYLNYLDWLKIVNMFKIGKFNHKENMDYVLDIKHNMNNKRTFFTWNHIKKFYNLDK